MVTTGTKLIPVIKKKGPYNEPTNFLTRSYVFDRIVRYQRMHWAILHRNNENYIVGVVTSKCWCPRSVRTFSFCMLSLILKHAALLLRNESPHGARHPQTLKSHLRQQGAPATFIGNCDSSSMAAAGENYNPPVLSDGNHLRYDDCGNPLVRNSNGTWILHPGLANVGHFLSGLIGS